MSLYSFAKSLVYVIFKPLYRIKITGLEHFPKQGAVLLCSNHIDNFDPPVVGITAPRKVHFMAKAEAFKLPILGKLLPDLGAFPVRRGMSDREALRVGLKILKEGNVLGLFPEGTRSRNGQLGQGLSGAGFFALRSDALIVPCAIIGPYKAFRPLKVVYGKPVNIDDLRARKASADETTELIMKEIQNLLEKNR